MKKQLLFLLFITVIFCQSAAAQKIYFTDTSNRWVELISGGGTEYYQTRDVIRLQGDTTVGGHTYKVMRADVTVLQQTGAPAGNYPGGPYFFREDTGSQRVWGRMASDTAETVIYNAAWQVGDTAFRLANTKYFVSKKDSVSIGSTIHKVFRFKTNLAPMGTVDALIIVEGIGSTYGPFFPVFPSANFEYNAQLKCFHHGTATPPLSAALVSASGELSNHFDNATSCALAVNDVQRIAGVAVIPNPGGASMSVRFASPLALGRLTIYNSYGQIVLQKSLQGERSISIGNMLSITGEYLYKIDDLQNGGTATGKIIFFRN